MNIQEEFAGYKARGLTVAELSRRSEYSVVTVAKFVTGGRVSEETEDNLRIALKQYDMEQINHLKAQGLI